MSGSQSPQPTTVNSGNNNYGTSWPGQQQQQQMAISEIPLNNNSSGNGESIYPSAAQLVGVKEAPAAVISKSPSPSQDETSSSGLVRRVTEKDYASVFDQNPVAMVGNVCISFSKYFPVFALDFTIFFLTIFISKIGLVQHGRQLCGLQQVL